ncbi:NAD(P)-dependent oxidoreductase [Variovorax rhizosphaerae]|uniref:NAD(P)-dependent oxidoreductase n=1 Tax=Variovorax rhizosphaerae TaxID=1836200 RepID=A0ABU8WC48_9BURK
MASTEIHRQTFRVAVIGVGMMGTAIAQRFIDCGHQLSLHTRSLEKLRPLVDQGARAAASPADAARGCDFVITCVNSADIVRSVVFGGGGVAEVIAPPAVLIDMSSIDPASTRQLAQELRGRCKVAWVDAPLSGGAAKAAKGQLTVMAGGDADAVAHAHALMQDLCANYTHMGPSGAGQTTKLVNQVLCALGFQAMAEAVRLAEMGGVDAGRLADALRGGRADSNILQEFAPQMAARHYPPTGALSLVLKDVDGVQALARSAGLALPLTTAARQVYASLVDGGLGTAQVAELMRQFDGAARIPL